jgi:hypothetical protein
MIIHQGRTVLNHEEIKAKVDIHQEKMEAVIYYLQPEFEKTMKHRVEDVL